MSFPPTFSFTQSPIEVWTLSNLLTVSVPQIVSIIEPNHLTLSIKKLIKPKNKCATALIGCLNTFAKNSAILIPTLAILANK